MNPTLTNPFISILIRSTNRLPHVKKIIDVCADQDYNNYEIVIIDQSENKHWEKHKFMFEKKGKLNRITMNIENNHYS